MVFLRVAAFLLLVLINFSNDVIGQIQIELPDTVTLDGNDLNHILPVKVVGTNSSEDVVDGFTIEFEFNSDYLEITDISTANTLVESNNFLVESNNTNTNRFIISGAGSSSITEDGTLINLEINFSDQISRSIISVVNIDINEGLEEVSSDSSYLRFGNTKPIPNFDFTTDQLTANFESLSTDPDGDSLSLEWDFDFNEAISFEENPIVNFPSEGDYMIKLLVSDGIEEDSISIIVPVIISSVDELNELGISDYSIQQNYPNPFNPSTNINYRIPEASKVSIVVYDMLGQKVAELVNAEQSAGNHAVLFDASNLSSGVYIYQLRAGSFTQTRKMTLIK